MVVLVLLLSVCCASVIGDVVTAQSMKVLPVECMTGYDTIYIKECESHCSCEWGYCQKCCRLSNQICESHDPIGWVIKGTVHTCSKGYTLDPIMTPCFFKCGLNPSHTNSEAKCCSMQYVNGACPPPMDPKPLQKPLSVPPISKQVAVVIKLPTSFQPPFVSSASNQRNCGSCYAHAAVGVLRDRFGLDRKDHSDFLFSPQPFLTCGPMSQVCGGGFPADVFLWAISKGMTTCTDECKAGCHPYIFGREGGLFTKKSCIGDYIDRSTDIPESCSKHGECSKSGDCKMCLKYDTANNKCYVKQKVLTKMSYSPCSESNPSPTCTDQTFTRLTNFADYEAVDYKWNIAMTQVGVHFQKPLSLIEEQLMREIYLRGSISNTFNVHDGFTEFFDKNPKGIYTQAEFKNAGEKKEKHAVRTIGWGEEGGTKYWLVMNSWGSKWADKGAFRIQRGVDLATYETQLIQWLSKKQKTQTNSHSFVPQAVGDEIRDDGERVGGWDKVESYKHGMEAVHFIMTQKDEFSNANVAPTNNVHKVYWINDIKEMVGADGYIYQVDFNTINEKGQDYNHFNEVLVRTRTGVMERLLQPSVGITPTGTTTNSATPKMMMGWAPYLANNKPVSRYDFSGATVKYLGIETNQSDNIQTTYGPQHYRTLVGVGLCVLVAAVAATVLAVRNRRHRAVEEIIQIPLCGNDA